MGNITWAITCVLIGTMAGVGAHVFGPSPIFVALAVTANVYIWGR